MVFDPDTYDDPNTYYYGYEDETEVDNVLAYSFLEEEQRRKKNQSWTNYFIELAYGREAAIGPDRRATENRAVSLDEWTEEISRRKVERTRRVEEARRAEEWAEVVAQRRLYEEPMLYDA